jgi:RHS repeat-associated protein
MVSTKVWYRGTHLRTTLYAVDVRGEVVAHAVYDVWGSPLTETYTDTNFSGMESLLSYATYSWDETLELWYAQARMYDAETGRFVSEDPARDGANWYVYAGGNPGNAADPWGLLLLDLNLKANKAGKFIDELRRLQEVLVYLGYLNMGNDPYGQNFGAKTDSAVRTFQYDYGFNVTGIVDDRMFMAILNTYLLKAFSGIEAKRRYDSAQNSLSAKNTKVFGKGYKQYFRPYQCVMKASGPILTPALVSAGVAIVTIGGEQYYDFTMPIRQMLQRNLALCKSHRFNSLEEIVDYYRRTMTSAGFFSIPPSSFVNEYLAGKIDSALWLISMADNNKAWDIKRIPQWTVQFNGLPYLGINKDFVFDGMILNAEQLGNYVFAYLGTDLGFSQTDLLTGGEIVSIYTGQGRDSEDDKAWVKNGVAAYIAQFGGPSGA